MANSIQVCIGWRFLKDADIILSTTSEMVSRLIRVGTFSKVSHAALYLGSGMVAEAIGAGVRRVTLQEALSDDTLAVAYRHPAISDPQRTKIIEFVNGKVDLTKYDYVGVASPGVRNVSRAVSTIGFQIVGALGTVVAVTTEIAGSRNEDYYCSELIVAAYRHAGMELGAIQPAESTPAQLAQMGARGKLLYVGHLKR